MKYAIIADVHANLEALQAVLRDAKDQGCTDYAFLGDFVGYCADPKACIDILRAMNAPCVKGNHDEYCSADPPFGSFNPGAARAVQWTRKQLTEDDRQWLRDLPYVRTVNGFTIVHATLDGPERWGYVFDKLAAAASFAHQGTLVCFLCFVQRLEDDEGPILTITEFRIDPAESVKFLALMQEIGNERMRDGAYAWNVYHDPDDPGRFVETYHVQSLLELKYRAQRETRADELIEEHIDRLLKEPSRTSYLIASKRRRRGW